MFSLQASGRDEDSLVCDVDELWQRRIIREQGRDAYDFSHDKLREGAYISLSNARRRLLHRRVAEALELVNVATLDRVSGQVAVHYEQAGLPQQAIPFYQRAGAAAVLRYASFGCSRLFPTRAHPPWGPSSPRSPESERHSDEECFSV